VFYGPGKAGVHRGVQVADGRRGFLGRVINFLNVMRVDVGQFQVFDLGEGVAVDIAFVAVNRAGRELWRDGFDPDLKIPLERQTSSADAARLNVVVHLASLGLRRLERAVERVIYKRPLLPGAA